MPVFRQVMPDRRLKAAAAASVATLALLCGLRFSLLLLGFSHRFCVCFLQRLIGLRAFLVGFFDGFRLVAKDFLIRFLNGFCAVGLQTFFIGFLNVLFAERLQRLQLYGCWFL